MKFTVRFLSVFACMIASLSWNIEAARDEDSERQRISGKEPASEGQFPWAASLYRDGSFICTCSIIGESTVLTSAACVVQVGVTEPASSFYAIANVDRSAEAVRIDFDSITPHPEYSESGFQNDIAVLKTTKPIAFSDTVQPICIARSSSGPMEYRYPLAMGWGSIRSRIGFLIFPEILHYYTELQVGTNECRALYLMEDYKICGRELLQRICFGDFGGPLIFDDERDDQDPVQIGVASYGRSASACGSRTPSVWTRTSSFNVFIREVAGDDPLLCEI